ncbi:MAG: S8 family serine peptidase, partial [Candidatus Kapaibacteriota bacterium]
VVFSASSSSINPDEVDSTLFDPSGNYIGSVGTSMSAPCVTGAVALLFEQNPNLFVDEIIELLKLSARSDEHTGTIPNNNFGWGKLDVLRMLQLVTEVREKKIHNKVVVLPNPASEQIFVSCDEPIELIEIFDILGNLVKTSTTQAIFVDELSSGFYVLKVRTTKGVYLNSLVLR